jgi:hypothetical protein
MTAHDELVAALQGIAVLLVLTFLFCILLQVTQ